MANMDGVPGTADGPESIFLSVRSENRGPRPANRRGGRGGYGEITEHQNSFNILPINPIIEMAEKVMAKVNSRTI
jgi:hypothetical protein